MSLNLAKSNCDCKTTSGGSGRGFISDGIRIGVEYIHPDDFVELVMYVMTNTDLEDDDPRMQLRERIISLWSMQGFNRGNHRYEEDML